MHNIYILGGHALSFGYYQTLSQAIRQGKISCHQLIMIDPSTDCHAIKEGDPSAVITKSYSQFIIDYLKTPQEYHPEDVLVPDHTAKHVLLQVYLDLIQQSFPHLKVAPEPIESSFQPPFLHKSDDQSHWAMSYATWTCPVDCDEPLICPHTKGSRDWEMGQSIESLHQNSQTFLHRFACEAFVNQISKIDMTTIIQKTSEFMQSIQSDLPKTYMVATHSHCHGIVGQFKVHS